jgi:hypothetical protein
MINGINNKKMKLIFESKVPIWTIMYAFLFGSFLIILSLTITFYYDLDFITGIILGSTGIIHIFVSIYLIIARNRNPYRIYDFGIEFPKTFKTKERKLLYYNDIEKIYRKKGLLTILGKDGTEYLIDRLKYENILSPYLIEVIGKERWLKLYDESPIY